MLWKDGKKKAVTLSYDDAVIHDRRFIELLNKYNIPCTFNLVSGWFEKDKIEVDYSKEPVEEFKHIKVSEAEVLDLYKNHEVASHALTHPNLTQLSKEEIIYQVSKDVENLERITGNRVRGFAYPYGAYNDEVVEALKECGIVYARTVESTNEFGIPEDFLRWKPTTYNEHEDMMDTARRFIESDNEGDLFYLWGHSYEFYMGKEWDKMEEFMKLMYEHKDEIWFATNIEIYDYVKEHK